jgi:hypothetical protein
MKHHKLALIAAVAMIFCDLHMAVAQWSPLYGSVTQGPFGPRVIGRPSTGTATMGTFGNRAVGQQLVQGPGSFTSNFQISPYGGYVYNNPGFGYQVVVPNPTPGPWYENNLLTYTPELAYGPTPESIVGQNGVPLVPGNTAIPLGAQENTIPVAVPVGTTPATQQGANTGNTQQSANPANTQQGANPGTAQPGTNTGNTQTGASTSTAMPGLSNITPQRPRFYTASVLSARPQTYTRSPELSNRLTSLARDKGMLVGKGINVYISNDVAVVQGTVRTPADSAVLASVLGLEPEVEHIDNRLSVSTMGN